MLKKLRARLRRNRPDFVGRLIRQAEHTVVGINMLLAHMEDHADETAEAVRVTEKQADEERRLLIDELNRTFVTPTRTPQRDRPPRDQRPNCRWRRSATR